MVTYYPKPGQTVASRLVSAGFPVKYAAKKETGRVDSTFGPFWTDPRWSQATLSAVRCSGGRGADSLGVNWRDR
jgi:hypothetical protein